MIYVATHCPIGEPVVAMEIHMGQDTGFAINKHPKMMK